MCDLTVDLYNLEHTFNGSSTIENEQENVKNFEQKFIRILSDQVLSTVRK